MTESPLSSRAIGLRNAAFERRAMPFVRARILNESDLMTLDLVAPRFGESDPEVLLGLAFAVRAPRAGHVGVLLRAIAGHVDDELLSWGPRGESEHVVWPDDLDGWAKRVAASPLVGDASAAARPFVRETFADGRQLILTRRLWDEQERTATALLTLAPSPVARPLSSDALEAGLVSLFGPETDSEAAAAVRTAATRRLIVVTGGPGTGKTYSIKRLLALLLTELAPSPEAPGFRIALAAPTGKAAGRMATAMGEDLDKLAAAQPVKAALRALVPRTLHKLLGMRPDGSVRHDARHPLPFDLVVVDEASMVDLALMRRLVEAIPEGARLVLLGDRDQLASVEAGSVLADVVGAGTPPDQATSKTPPLGGAIVRFSRSRRFEDAPGIGAVAAAIQRGDEASLVYAVALLRGEQDAPGETLPGRLRSLGIAVDGHPSIEQLAALTAPYFDIGYGRVLEEALAASGPSALIRPEVVAATLDALDCYRVLAVHRRGPLGVSGLSRALDERVQSRLRQATDAATPTNGAFWPGRLILITVNAYDVGLMNGDVGVILPEGQVEGRFSGLEGVFPAADGRSDSPPRRVAISRLPPHEGALVMTVHKSQGSQFDHVGLVLAGRESPIETRELVYTGITRARSQLTWLGDGGELARALRRRVLRTSGLAERLIAPA